MNPFGLSSLLVTAGCLGFGVFILLKGYNRRLNQLWALFYIEVSLWGVGGFLISLAKDPTLALILWKATIGIGVVWVPVVFYRAICELCHFSRPRVLRVYYVTAVLNSALYLTTNLLFKDVRYIFGQFFWNVIGPLHPLFMAWWSFIVVHAHLELWKAFRQNRGITRGQISSIFLGGLIAYTAGLLEFLPNYHIDLYPWSNFALPFYPAIMTYGIFKYQLFDIQLVIRRSILYSLFLGLLVAGYFGLVYAAQQLFQLTLLQHHILAISLTSITTFGLGLLVFLADPKRRLNQIFGLYSLAISWWSFCESFLIAAKDQLAADFWSFLAWPAVILISPFFLHTVLLSTRSGGKKTRFILWAAYGISLVFLTLHLFTNLISASVRPAVGYARFYNNLGKLGSCVPLIFFLLVNIALWKLWDAYRKSVGQQKVQLKYLFWASVIGYVGGSPDWFLAFGFAVPPLNPFGIYGVPMYSVATTYAVLHHSLFNVNFIVRKSLVYSLLVTVLTIGYFGLVYGVERLFQFSIGYSSHWMSLAAFALMALAFQPLKIGIQRLVDWLLFRAPHEELVKRMERLEHEAQQTEKLRYVATLAAGICHELKGPLQITQKNRTQVICEGIERTA